MCCKWFQLLQRQGCLKIGPSEKSERLIDKKINTVLYKLSLVSGASYAQCATENFPHSF